MNTLELCFYTLYHLHGSASAEQSVFFLIKCFVDDKTNLPLIKY